MMQKEAIDTARDEGIEEGIIKGQALNIHHMLECVIPIEQISSLSGLSIEEISQMPHIKDHTQRICDGLKDAK